MPDQPGEQPPLPVAEYEQKMVGINPTEPLLNASADGGELATQPQPNQPRSRLRAAIQAGHRTQRVASEPESELLPTFKEEETATPPGQFSIPTPYEKVPLPLEPTNELTEPEDFLPPEQIANLPSPEAPVEEKIQTPHQEEMEKAAKAQALISKAQIQARQGQLDQARKLFGQAVQQDPTNAEAWTWLGGLLTDINLERAKICLTRAVELDATNERANRGLAQVNSRLEAQTQERALVLARPEIKVGLEEIIERHRQNGIEADPESIPLGGARLRPAIEKGELKPYRTRRSRVRPFPVAWGLGLLACIVAVLIWLGPLSKSNPATPATVLPPNTSVAGLNGQPVTVGATISADETFALKMRLEIDKYNQFFLTARDLRQQVTHGKILWEDYQQSARQLQIEVKNEKKPLDNLALAATPKLIQYYRELQNIAAISNQAVDFTISGIDNTSPEDLEEGNRQFNQLAVHLTELLRRLNQQVPLATPLPGATSGPVSGTPPATLPISPSNFGTVTASNPTITVAFTPAQTISAAGTISPAPTQNLTPTPIP